MAGPTESAAAPVGLERDRAGLVSVVVPTRNRAGFVVRAVRSALAQTHPHVELVVVIDGPDRDTEEALRSIGDARLRWVSNAASLGAAEARNVGVRMARGQWLAFLDDDDEWLPTKLERQIEAMAQLPQPAVVSCRMIRRTTSGDTISPSRLPRPGESIGDFLFLSKRPLEPGGRLRTSALLISRDLALAIPWDRSLRRFQETNWLLRAGAAGARLVVVPEALVIINLMEASQSITGQHRADWRLALEWIDDHRQLIQPRHYSSFVLHRVEALSRRAADRPSMLWLWRRASERGQPTVADHLRFLFKVLIWPVRLRIKRFVQKLRGGRSAGAP